jgi:arylsulfatase A-like enzyme
MRLLAVAVVALAALAGAGAQDALAASKPNGQPNILFIVSDDQSSGTLCCDSTGAPWMPNTVKWFHRGDPLAPGQAPGGTFFPNAVATTPLCCPSRSSILTGHYAHNHGVRRNNDGPLMNPLSTLEYYLHEKARPRYWTGIFGKYLNGWELTQKPPFFDRWAIYNNGYHHLTSPPDTCPDPVVRNQGVGCINEQGQLKSVIGQYETGYLTDRVTEFINEAERTDGQPWFLYVAPTVPHARFQPEPGKYDHATKPEPYVPGFSGAPNYLESDLSDKPAYVQAAKPASETDQDALEAEIQAIRNAQLRMLKSLDDMVGKVFETLVAKSEGNTLAFFISDNAYLWGEHWLLAKPYPYTPALSVPLFMRWPGRVNSNVTDTRLAANIDLAPTVMKATGVTPDVPMDGRDLLDPTQVRARWLTESWRHTTNPRLTEAPTWASIRTPPPAASDLSTPYYHYIEYYDDAGEIIFREFYDLRTDPYELTNLFTNDGDSTNDPPLADVAHRQLELDRTCTGANCP